MNQTIKILFFALIFPYGANSYSQKIRIEIKDTAELPDTIYECIRNYKVILVGDYHGTEEIPGFVAGLTSLLLRHGKEVELLFEFPVAEDSLLKNFMKSRDTTLLRNSVFMNKKPGDGRQSRAMVNLLKACYTKEDLQIGCFVPRIADGYANRIDSLMSVEISKRIRLHPERTFIIFAGNYHTRWIDAPGVMGNGIPYYLVRNTALPFVHSDLLSVYNYHGGGTAWNCNAEGCGPHPLPERAEEYHKRVPWNMGFAVFENDPLSAVLYFRKVTASPPAFE